MVETNSPPADWRKGVRRQIAALVAEVTAVEEKKREAERLVAALVGHGDTDVPVLPWNGSKAPAVAPSNQKMCSECGKRRNITFGRYVAGRWLCVPCIRAEDAAAEALAEAQAVAS